MNYNMYNMEKTISKLHRMLKTVEQNIKTTSNVLMVQKGKGKDTKRKWVTKGKAKDNKKPKPNPDTKRKSLKLSNLRLRNQRKGNAFSAMSQVIGKGIASSTRKI